eukprot:6377346-Prymnesium_polylepis.1
MPAHAAAVKSTQRQLAAYKRLQRLSEHARGPLFRARARRRTFAGRGRSLERKRAPGTSARKANCREPRVGDGGKKRLATSKSSEHALPGAFLAMLK